MVLAAIVMVFTVLWAVWLWVLFYCPKWWSAFVDREHALLLRLGLIPASWSLAMRRLETGWFLKTVVGVTIFIVLITQRFL